MVIYFMRHTAVDVPQGVCYGQTDVPLKPTFEMEATQTAAHLQGLSFDKVSTMPEYQKVYAQGTNGKYSPYASTSWGPLISDCLTIRLMEEIRIMSLPSNMVSMKVCIMYLSGPLRD